MASVRPPVAAVTMTVFKNESYDNKATHMHSLYQWNLQVQGSTIQRYRGKGW